ncbi:MAG: ATP-binding protein, partial [Candidatus Brocadiales bacterium]|nr:ATP-binding protein [Candidatus Bathyanammoxibius amoris]
MAKKHIYVSKKILADIGRGIYRTPANAIKEIVSNAFDACATWVRITTNAPYFDVFTCEDNGRGMSSKEFEKILHRIGSSTKRANRAKYIDYRGIKRPIIGKIGIGLLAVSQICDRFTVISKRKGKRDLFEATIGLLQFEQEDAYFSGEGRIALGEYDMKEMSTSGEEVNISYTKLIMESLKEGFKRDLNEEYRKQIIRPKETSSKVISYANFVESLSGLKDFKAITTYDKMIWEL